MRIDNEWYIIDTIEGDGKGKKTEGEEEERRQRGEAVIKRVF